MLKTHVVGEGTVDGDGTNIVPKLHTERKCLSWKPQVVVNYIDNDQESGFGSNQSSENGDPEGRDHFLRNRAEIISLARSSPDEGAAVLYSEARDSIYLPTINDGAKYSDSKNSRRGSLLSITSKSSSRRSSIFSNSSLPSSQGISILSGVSNSSDAGSYMSPEVVRCIPTPRLRPLSLAQPVTQLKRVYGHKQIISKHVRPHSWA